MKKVQVSGFEPECLASLVPFIGDWKAKILTARLHLRVGRPNDSLI